MVKDSYYIVTKEQLHRLEACAFDYGYLSGGDASKTKVKQAQEYVALILKECVEVPYNFEEVSNGRIRQKYYKNKKEKS